jgi:tetratricopeptide (TPR) repeat protein
MKPNSIDRIYWDAAHIASPAERQAYLDQACGDEVRLRRKVEQLLEVRSQAEDFLESPALAPVVTAAEQPTSEGSGTVIGPYKLVEPIGEGGMGTVWMAQQQQPVRRVVALKLIKAGMDSKQVIARFEVERQALALMDHPNIARVLDAGTTDAGRPYFVMELVKGVPITRYCDEHRLTPRQRLELFIPVCQAIQHAHQKGIIHRDLKPSNVLVALYDGQPVPKVIDFGVAKAAGQSLTDKTLVTGFGAIIGTLEYMSPEQAELNQLDIDTRSDVYSLGVLLYELLTGSTPFSRNGSEQGGLLEMLRVIREQEPTKPSAKLSTAEGLPTLAADRGTEPARLTRLVRGELDWIVMKCLEKDRNRRYETAIGLARDVERYLHDEPVAAGPPSAWYRFRKFARRNKGRVAVTAGAFLAVLVMVGSIGWAVRDRAAQQAEAERRTRAGLDAARTLIAENKLIAARQRLAADRAQLGNDLARSGLASLAAEVEAAEDELDRLQQFLDLTDRAHQAETAPVLESGLAAAGGSPGRAGTRSPERTAERGPAAAVPFLLKALDCYAVLEHDDWDTALEGGLLGRDQIDQIRRTVYEELLWLAADLADRQQDHRSGRKLSRESAARAALVYLGKAENAHRPTQALYFLRAGCRKTLGEEAASQADSHLADKTAPTLAVDHQLRGMAACKARQLAEAIQAFEAALRLEPTHYWSLMLLGGCLTDLGQRPEDFTGATRVFTGCILRRPDHAHAYSYRGLAYAKLGQPDKAVADISKAIDLNPKLAWAWNNRGVVYCDDLRQAKEAVADFSQAIELDPKLASTWYNRGNAFSHLGQYDKAIIDYSRAIDLDPKLAPAWNNRGVVYCDHLDQHKKAVTDFTQAIELDPKLARAWCGRGVAYGKLGQPDKAVADCSRAIELDPKLASAWYNRGAAYSDLGKSDKAIADCSRAIELDPKLASAWYNRGIIYCENLGQPDKAVADYTQAINLDPKLGPAWYGRGAAYSDLGEYDKAVADYSRAIDLGPKLASVWYNRGFAYRKLGQPDKAISDYETVLKLSPAHAGAHNYLAWLLATSSDAKLRDPDRAVELAKKAVQLAPKVGNYWATLGVAHYRARDWKAAVAALDKSVELGRGWDAVDGLFLAMAYRKLGKNNESREAYDQALRWLEKNQASLAKNKVQAEELRRFRVEAEEVLELKKK